MTVNIIREREQVAGGQQAVRKELERLLDYGNIDLPMLPEHAARLVSMANRPESDAQMLASTIESDPSLAARVLRVARSAAYQSSSPVNSLEHAIAWLGLGEVADIAFTAVVQGRLLNVPVQQPRAVHLASPICAV